MTKRNLLFLCFLLTTLWVDGQNYVWTKVKQKSIYAYNPFVSTWAEGNAVTNGKVTYQIVNYGFYGSVYSPPVASNNVYCRDSTGKLLCEYTIGANTKIYSVTVGNNDIMHGMATTYTRGSFGAYSSLSSRLIRGYADGRPSQELFLGLSQRDVPNSVASDTTYSFGKVAVDDIGSDYINIDNKVTKQSTGALVSHRMLLLKWAITGATDWVKEFGDTAKVSAPTIFNSYATVGCNRGKVYVRGTLMADSFWYDGVRYKAAAGQVLLRFDTSGVYQGYTRVTNWNETNFSGFDSKGNILLTFSAYRSATVQLDTALSVMIPSIGLKHTIIACINPRTGMCLWYSTLYSIIGNTLVSALQVQPGNVIILTGTTDSSILVNGTSHLYGKEMFRAAMDSTGAISLLQRNPIISGGTSYPLTGWKSPGGDLLITDFIYDGNNFRYGCDSANSGSLVMSRWTPSAIIPAPLVAASGTAVTNRSLTSCKLRWKDGSGRARIVIIREANPVKISPVNGINYKASSTFGLGDSLGPNTYVVYNGTDTFVSLNGLKPATLYFVKVYEYNGCNTSSNYSANADSIQFATLSRHYYTKTSGFINDLATWGDSLNGGGNIPLSFEGDSITWHVVNNPLITMQPVALSITSNVIVGDSTNPVNFIIPDTAMFTARHIRITPNATLTVMGSTGATGYYGDSLSLIYLLDANLIGVGAVNCYDLKINSTSRTVTLANTCFVRNKFSMGGNIIGHIVLGTDTSNKGQLDYIKGTVYGIFMKYFSKALTAGNEELFPVGYKEGAGFSVFRSRHMRIRYTQAPSVGGSFEVSVGPKSPYTTYSGLPLTDASGSSIATLNKFGNTIWSVRTGVSGGLFSIIVTDTNPRGDSVAALRLLRIWNPMYGPPYRLVGRCGDYLGNSGTSFNPVVGSYNQINDWYNGWTGNMTEFVSGIDTNSFTLPVAWLTFQGKKVDRNALLTWVTSSEQNNSHFEIERSVDGFNFTYVGRKEGKGTTNSISEYGFTDIDAFSVAQSEVLYYRLKQVDYNGNYEYSRTIAINNNGQSMGRMELITFPNPFTEQLNLTLNNVSEGAVIIEVYDLSGRKHFTQKTLSDGQGTMSIDLSSLANLAKGVYIVNIRNGNDAIQQKLVKLK